MLKHLHISNYALISELDIEFSKGLNIITGETGAGKSIMLGALSMVFGAKADLKSSSNPANKTIVEATFSAPPLLLEPLISEAGAEWNADELIIRREINPAGRSRSFVNDSPVQLAILKEIAAQLVDIHSQHQNQLLAKPEFQLGIIDTLAQNDELLTQYSEHYSHLRSALKALKEKKITFKNSAENSEFLRFRLQRLEKANPLPDEDLEIEKEYTRIKALAEKKTRLNTACALLANNNGNGANQLLENLSSLIPELEKSFPESLNLRERLDKILAETHDIEAEFASAADKLDIDASQLDNLELRLAELNELKQQFKVKSTTELASLQQKIADELSALESAPLILREAENNARQKLAKAKETASLISSRRKQTAKQLESEIQSTAQPLGMRNLVCQINISDSDIGPTGADSVEFLFAFNKNQTPVPVANSASGGEISRLMLSIKSIVADRVYLPTILFDEIDTGVSGTVASKIGNMMHDISKSLQTIVITHLPQVASQPGKHFKVFKTDSESSTNTHVRELNSSERVDEIALMLGGDSSSLTARNAAIELLDKNLNTTHGKK